MSQRTCAVPICENSGRLIRGWCTMHYQRWRKHGDVLWEPPSYPSDCSVEGCGKARQSQGLCTTHYMRVRRTGTTDDRPRSRQQDRPCSLEGCESSAAVSGLCSAHYTRLRRHGDPMALLRARNTAPPEFCTVESCGAAHHAKGVCVDHYRQAHHAKHREARNEQMREHYRKNREMYTAKSARRRRGLREALDDFDVVLSNAYRLAIANDPCSYCGSPGEAVDHVFPVAKGGTDHWWNLARACTSCNLSKAAHCGVWFRLKAGGVVESRLAPAVA